MNISLGIVLHDFPQVLSQLQEGQLGSDICWGEDATDQEESEHDVEEEHQW